MLFERLAFMARRQLITSGASAASNTHIGRAVTTEIVKTLETLQTVTCEGISHIFSQFGHDQGPAEYEIDNIVGGIVERGRQLPTRRHGAHTDTP